MCNSYHVFGVDRWGTFYTLSNLTWIPTLQDSYYYHLQSIHEYRGLERLSHFPRDVQPVIGVAGVCSRPVLAFFFLKSKH